nr:hypothetical protein [Tanacetum cinerariifolium]
DGKKVVVNEAYIRCDLRLDDVEGTTCLPTATIFEELARIGDMSHYKGTFFNPSLTKKRRMNDQDLFRVHDLDGDEVFVDVTTGENVE